MQQFWQQTFWGNSVADYLLAIGVIGGGILVIRLLQAIVLHRLRRWARRTTTALDDRLMRIVARPLSFLLYLGTFYVAIANLTLHPIVQQVVQVLTVILATVLTLLLLGSLVEYGARLYLVKREHDPALEQTLQAVVPAIKVIVWAIGLVFLLDNLGFDISAVVATLGIGGVAVALAAQGILADLFSYVSILFDRPFELGDFIIVGDLLGTVEQVGIKTTRLRSLTGEQLVIANTDITSSRLQNFKRMERRRVAFHLGVTYETETNQMRDIPSLIEQAIAATENTTFDRAHFASYGDFSLNYEVVYYVESPDYTIYMDAQQQINLRLKADFEQRGIEFAYPTQLLYLNQMAATETGNGQSNPQLAHQN